MLADKDNLVPLNRPHNYHINFCWMQFTASQIGILLNGNCRVGNPDATVIKLAKN